MPTDAMWLRCALSTVLPEQSSLFVITNATTCFSTARTLCFSLARAPACLFACLCRSSRTTASRQPMHASSSIFMAAVVVDLKKLGPSDVVGGWRCGSVRR